MPDHAEFNWRDTIDRGLYPVSTVARLTGADPANITNWVRGRASMKPIIIRQYPDAGAKAVLGFLDLIDVLFVAHFRKLGLSLQSIRKVAAKLRARHGTDHPFATQRFRTDGKAIFAEEVDTNEERRILNLMNDNFELGEIIKRSLFEDLFMSGILLLVGGQILICREFWWTRRWRLACRPLRVKVCLRAPSMTLGWLRKVRWPPSQMRIA